MVNHPADLELLALVEGELSRAEAGVLEAHLAACADCRVAVEAQRGARALLRAAPPVTPLAPQQVRDLVRALPPHPRPSPWWSRRPTVVWRLRPVHVLAPAGAAAVAVVLAISLSGGSEPAPAPEALGGPPPAALSKEAPTGASAGASTGASAATAKAATPAAATPKAPAATSLTQADASVLLGRVEGPAARVVAFLKARGIAARVVDGRVTVRKTDGQRARKALASRPAGPVEVVSR